MILLPAQWLRLFLVRFCAFLWLSISGSSALSQTNLSDDALAKISFVQNLNAQIPAHLSFRDETGQAVQLKNYFGKKPAVLVLGYYECPMLCTLVLNGLIESMQDLRWTAGKEFDVINISIDPNEKPALVAAKKRTCLKRYGRNRAANGWHFLTGDTPAIEQISQAVGFQYAYDSTSKQYAHPSGFIVLTPDGRVSRYFFGVTFSARELYAALQAASTRSIGSRIQEFVLLCFHYRPITSKYGGAILLSVRGLAIATLAGLAFLIFKASRNRLTTVSPVSPDAAREGIANRSN